MTSFDAQGEEFQTEVKKFLSERGVELRRHKWVFYWVFVEWLIIISEVTLPLGVKYRRIESRATWKLSFQVAI